MLLDTYAWIELIKGTKGGLKVKEIIENNQCFSSVISIAELSEWIEKNKFKRKSINVIKDLSKIIELEEHTLELAGILKVQKRRKMKNIGLIDAIIIATARQYDLQVVTGDKHFKDENAIML